MPQLGASLSKKYTDENPGAQAGARKERGGERRPKNTLNVYDRLEAAPEHALAVEGHFHSAAHVFFHGGIGHHFLPDLLAVALRFESDEGCHDDFTGFQFHAARIRSALALGH